MIIEQESRIYSNNEDLSRIIKKCIKNGSEILTWVSIGGKRELAPLKISRINKDDNLIKVRIEQASEKLNSIIEKNGFLNIFIPETFVLFRLDIKKREEEFYHLAFPEKFFRKERRRTLRLNLRAKEDDDWNLDFSIFKTVLITFKKQVIDFCAGGCSFYVNKTEYRMFVLDTLITGVMFRYNGVLVFGNAVVAYKQMIEPAPGNDLAYTSYRVGFEFVNLNRKQIGNINREVIRSFKEPVGGA